MCISVSAQVEEFYAFENDNNYVYDILNSNGEYAYFVRLNQTTGIRGLWFTDGTEEGTSIISSDLNVFSTGRYDVGYLNNQFYFFASEPVENFSDRIVSLYAYNELSESVELIKQGNDDSNTHFIYSYEHAVYFSMRSENADPELWMVNQNGLSKISIPACGGSSLTEDVIDFSRKPVEAFNSTNQVHELYFVNYCGDLVRHTDGSVVNMFEEFGFRTGNANPFSVYNDMYTIYDRKFIFFGQNLLNGSSNSTEGVHSIDLDSGEYQLLVENTHKLRAQEYPARRSYRKTFIQTEDGVYFAALDNTALSSTNNGQKDNNNIWVSDGTSAETSKIVFLEDELPRPVWNGLLSVELQKIIGSQLIYTTVSYDDDPLDGELFAVNINTSEITKLWDATNTTGFPHGHLMDGFGYVLRDFVPDSSRTLFISSDGFTSKMQSRTTTGEVYNLEPGSNSFVANIQDSIYIFKAKVGGNPNTSLMKFTFRGGSSDSGDNGNNGGGEEPINPVMIYEERFAPNFIGSSVLTENWSTDITSESDGWIIEDKNRFSSLFEELDLRWLNTFLLTLYGADPEQAVTITTTSPKIPIHDYSDLSVKLDYYYQPDLLEFQNATLNLDVSSDSEQWITIKSVTGSDLSELLYEEFEVQLSTQFEGDSLKFRLRIVSDEGGSFGVPMGFYVDDITLFGVPDQLPEPEPEYSITELVAVDFTEDEFLQWQLVESEAYDVYPESTWHLSDLSQRYESTDVLPGISLNNHLRIFPSAGIRSESGDFISYNEIFASPFYDLQSTSDLRLALNFIYTPQMVEADEVEFNVLGRPDTSSQWQTLYTLETNPEQLGNLSGLNLEEIDVDLSGNYTSEQLQVGLQLKINNLQYSGNTFGYFADSLLIYSREEVVNQSPVVVSTPETLVLAQDFGEYRVTDIDSYFNDPENDPLSYEVISIPSFLDASVNADVLILNSKTGETGTGELIIRATDSKGASADLTIMVEVTVETGISDETDNQMPTEFTISQNYPNPFNPSSNIRFGLPESGEVRLEVYNMLGQRVATLVDQRMQAGWHTVTFDASTLSTGTYIYRITSGDFVQTKKMMLIK